MSRPTLDPSVSLYLDLARIGAAFVVLLHHVLQPPYNSATIHFPGRSAVIVFFVISGYVIAFAADGRNDWRAYAAARLARIYSVAIPALLLTGVLVLAANRFWPDVPVERYDWPVLRLLLSSIFVNQFWNLTIAALSNGPYWSLCYEVWYYILFGVVWFGRGLGRWLAVALITLLVGPRILLLLPVWVLGAALYFAMQLRPAVPAVPRPWLFLVSVTALLLVLFVANPMDAVSDLVERSLHDGYLKVGAWRVFIGGDWRFPSDYFAGLLFALSVWLSGGSFGARFPSQVGGRAIRWCSSYTFSLYLYHVPLLIFLHVVLQTWVRGPWMPWVLLALILLCVWALGSVTEHRKAPYANFFRRLLRAEMPPRAIASPPR